MSGLDESATTWSVRRASERAYSSSGVHGVPATSAIPFASSRLASLVFPSRRASANSRSTPASVAASSPCGLSFAFCVMYATRSDIRLTGAWADEVAGQKPSATTSTAVNANLSMFDAPSSARPVA